MFDPFKDFEQAGYLRNRYGEKDPQIVQELEHQLFRAGLDEALVRRTARIIAGARAFASFEDLGVQMNHHSTLVSYLHKLLVALTGSIGKPGAQFIPTTMVPLWGGEASKPSPVVGARIISGLIPCNVIADEILTEHPKRYRAMIVEAANPAHSLADSKRMREALRALDTVVVIDVAMTETARLADYVLPAATQFEKAEATFFNFEFPANVFHLRSRLFPPPDGPLPEAEIHARLCTALGAITDEHLAPLRAAASSGRIAYAEALMAHVLGDSKLTHMAPVLLYRTMDLPVEQREGAVLFGLALRLAMQAPAALQRAGFGGTPLEMADALFTAILNSPSGLVFAVDEWADVLSRIATPDRKVHLALPDLLDELARMLNEPAVHDTEFPFVLSAGERRSFTANTIVRDPLWRKKDPGGALRVSPADAAELGVTSGDAVRLSTRRDSVVVTIEVSDSMQRGHLALPNGLGVTYPPTDALPGAAQDQTPSRAVPAGVAPNELTATTDRDPFVGTPWHKHVPARLARL